MEGEVRLVGESGLHGLAVELTVDLRAGTAHGRALRPIKHAKLNTGLIGHPAH